MDTGVRVGMGGQFKMIELGQNIIRLDGYGVYVTVVDGKAHISEIMPDGSCPTLDPDGCIDWTELTDPDNQQFLEIINDKFGLDLIMTDFDKNMSVREILNHVKVQEEREKKEEPMTDAQARWFVKNLREKHK
jgi:hypothetical protein